MGAFQPFITMPKRPFKILLPPCSRRPRLHIGSTPSDPKFSFTWLELLEIQAYVNIRFRVPRNEGFQPFDLIGMGVRRQRNIDSKRGIELSAILSVTTNFSFRSLQLRASGA